MVEGRRVAEEGARIVAHELLAVEDARVGLHRSGAELVVHQRLDVGQEAVALGIVLPEVLEHLDAEDQPVLALPLDADVGRQAGAEQGLRFVEVVVGVFPVVEACVEVGACEHLLRPDCTGRGDEHSRGEDDLSERHKCMIEPPKIGKNFLFDYFCTRKQPIVSTMRKITNAELGRPSAEEFAAMAKMPVVVVLDNIRSLQNVGAFFRTSDAFAVERIALCGITATPPNRDIHKTALGAELTVPWRHYAATEECLAELKAEGYSLWAVEQVEGAVRLGDFRPEAGVRYALVFGNEVLGVGQQAVDLCDGAIEIPQAGTKHSINVSVSGGVVLWHFFDRLWTLKG